MTELPDRWTLLWNNRLYLGLVAMPRVALFVGSIDFPPMTWFENTQTHADTSDRIQWMHASQTLTSGKPTSSRSKLACRESTNRPMHLNLPAYET